MDAAGWGEVYAEAPTREAMRRRLGPGHDYATNRGRLKAFRQKVGAHPRGRRRSRPVRPVKVPASLRRLLEL